MKNSHFDDSNHYFQLASDFVINTSTAVYLTGKAGTGKTTFLRYIRQHCEKNMVVVAPTGVAAINAGGVTLHSFFQLPFGPFVADAPSGFGINDQVVNKHRLLHNLKIGGNKRKLIQELELLIIDEVSMLRCDMLDAMDHVLRWIRKNQKPFGGVQVLLIGDLYQLPPVVTEHEAELFRSAYQSPFFFHARVFEQTQMVFIELKKIYRQNEQHFIDLLNKIRNSEMGSDDYDLLNSRYDPHFSPKDQQYITLTSHNYKADTINSAKLKQLDAPLLEFSGEVKGDFSDKHLPTEKTLKLKTGAQVMFIKNDSSGNGRYYNGKLATIAEINSASIMVRFPDTGELFNVEKETWENITYHHNEETQKAEEEVLGSFTQYPLRLAWAITIHKSQGLTFTHAIIDAGSSFAPGQVYVALSRCTSLAGIVLQSKLSPAAVHSDERIQRFGMQENSIQDLQQVLEKEKMQYSCERLSSLFQWKALIDQLFELQQTTVNNKLIPISFEGPAFFTTLIEKLRVQEDIAAKFIRELDTLFNEYFFFIQAQKKGQIEEKINARLQKAITYFVSRLHNEMLLPLKQFISQFDGMARVKKYRATLEDAEQTLWQRIERLQTAHFNGNRILPNDLFVKNASTENRPKPKKKEKGDSARETLAYYSAGKTLAEISKIRRLAESTIEGHLAEFVLKGELDVFRFVGQDDLAIVKTAYDKNPVYATTHIVQELNNRLTHGQVKMALNHLLYTQQIQKKAASDLATK